MALIVFDLWSLIPVSCVWVSEGLSASDTNGNSYELYCKFEYIKGETHYCLYFVININLRLIRMWYYNWLIYYLQTIVINCFDISFFFL